MEKKRTQINLLLLIMAFLIIPFAVNAQKTDAAGQDWITDITFASNNQNQTVCRAGDEIVLTYKVKDGITVETVMIAGKEVEPVAEGELQKAVYVLPEDFSGQTADYSISCTDGKETKEITADVPLQYYAKLSITDVHFVSDNQTDDQSATADNTVTFSFMVNHELTDLKEITIADQNVALEKAEQNEDGLIQYAGSLSLKDIDLEDAKAIPVNIDTISTVHDAAGNTADVVLNDTVVFYQPLAVSDVTYQADNVHSSTDAVDGNTLTFSFYTNHKLKETYSVIIAESETQLTETEKDGKVYYSATYQVPSGTFQDNEKIHVDLSAVKTVCDPAGHTAQIKTANQTITYHSPIEITNISFSSDNENQAVCKNGDHLTFSFSSNRKLIVPESIKIAGTEVALKGKASSAGFVYSAEYIISQDSLEDQKAVPIDLSNLKSIQDDYGNSVAIQTDETITYYAPLTVSNPSFISNNKVLDTAKNGDVLTFSFETNHAITSDKTVKIGDTVLQLKEEIQKDGRVQYSAAYTVTGDEFSDLETVQPDISALKNMCDAAGNQGTLTLNSDVTYYAPIQLNDVAFTSNNDDSAVAINGNTLTFSFTVNHELSVQPMVKIGNEAITMYYTETDKGLTYTAFYTVPGETYDDAVTIPLDLTQLKDIADVAGNTITVTCDQSITYYCPVEITDVSYFSDDQRKDLAIDGSQLTFSFQSNHKLSDAGMVIIGGQEVPLSEKTDQGLFIYFAEYIVPAETFSDEKEITLDLSKLSIQDIYGNQGEISCNDTITYYAPLQISDVAFVSNNDDPAVAINGNTVTFSFMANHELTGDYSVMINHQQVILSGERIGDAVRYSAEYAIDGGMDDTQIVPLDCTGTQHLTDAAGQTASAKTESSIIYYAPYSDSNILSHLMTCTGNNVDGHYYVKNGDSVTFTFKSNRKLRSSQFMVAGNTVDMTTSDDGYEWIGSFSFDQLNDNLNVPFQVSITDFYGNQAYTVPADWFLPVTYYAPIQITVIDFTSNNGHGHSLAKNGDVVTVSFTTNHPVYMTEGTIGGKPVTFQTTDNCHFSGQVTVDGSMAADQNAIPYRVTIADNSNNDTVTADQSWTDQLIYYAPIQINDVSFTSNNVNDGSKYVKDGDTVTLTATSNHQVTLTGTVADSDVQAVGDGTAYSANAVVNGWSDQQAVTYTMIAEDIAGNTPLEITTANTPELKYYAPIQAQAAVTSNNAKNSQFAKAGDTITATISANHEIQANGQIHGFTAASSASGSTVQVSLTLDGGSQGSINTAFTIDDVAGNTTAIEQPTTIIYDDIAPILKIDPVVSGFMNKNIGITVTAEDIYLDAAASNVTVNDTNYLRSESDKKATATIELKDDGTYQINGVAEDQAGNRSEQSGGTVIIDQTAPQIVTMNIDLDKQPAYKAGVVMADYFTIKEDYLDTVNCLLTHKTGIQRTVNWNLDEQIKTEGEKAMQLSATDKATNVSDEVNYGFFVDGTRPKEIVTDTTTNTYLTENKINTLGKNTKVKIELDEIWVGNEIPDYFTQLEIRNIDTNETVNLLQNEKISSTTYQLKETGTYQLTLAAVDEVGNTLDPITYRLNIQEDTQSAISPDSLISPLSFLFILLAGIAVIIIAFVIIKNRKQNQNDPKEK